MSDRQRPESFEWDDRNEAEHVANHGVAFDVAVGVFLDPRRLEAEDLRPDKVKRYGERRWNTVGLVNGRHVNVTFAMNGSTARIISARPAHRKERERYGYDP